MLKLFRPKQSPASQTHHSSPPCSSCYNLQRFESSSGTIISSTFNWDLKELAAARLNICSICTFVCTALDAIIEHEGITEFHSVLVRATLHMSRSTVANEKVFRKNETVLEIHLSVGTFLITGTNWNVYVQKGSTPLPWIRLAQTPSKRFFGNTGSEKAASWFKTQIDRCTSKHDLCAGRAGLVHSKSTRERLLPKRVIELLDDDRLRLKTPESDEIGVYACLSHCWGGKQALTTTKETLVNHVDNIILDALPRTFRDAIMFLKYLKIKYIWIDSLCIIQDSKEDWFEESGKMAEIYANAFITVAATRAGSGDAGLFSDTKSLSVNVGTSEVLLCQKPIHASPGNVTSNEFPLLKRGWVAQELLLSPRLLQFCNGEMIFECMEGLFCSCGEAKHESHGVKNKIWATSQGDPKRDAKGSLHQTSKYSKWQLPNNAPYHAAHFGEWRSFAAHYSDLSLTFQEDRLPAMSGLARRFATGLITTNTPAAGATYAAGMWKENMHNDLLWHVPHRAKPKGRLDDTTAPTWSWVTCATSVGWWGCEPNAKIMFEVLHIQCEPLSEYDLFGMLSESMLKLKGPIVGMRLRKSRKHYDVELEDRWGVECTPDFDLDSLIREDSSKFVGMPIVQNSGVLRGLMLWKRDSATYERVGLWFCDGADGYYKQRDPEEDWRAEQLGDWLERLPPSEVVIV